MLHLSLASIVGSQEQQHNQQARNEEKCVDRISGIADDLIEESSLRDDSEELQGKFAC